MGPPVDENQFLFYGRRGQQVYSIFKLDLKRDFSPVETAAAVSPNFSLKRCSASSPPSAAASLPTVAAGSRKRRRRRSWNCSPPSAAASLPTVAAGSRKRRRRSWNWMGRCNRHLTLRYKFRQLRSRMERAVIPYPKPFFEIDCTPREGSFPQEFAMAAVESKLYLFGGYSWEGELKYYRSGDFLPKDVHYIDATADSGVMVKMPSQMNSGKRSPLAWTVARKIYVLPSVFSFGEKPGHFECFDPKSGSWTILPSPPFVDYKSEFTVPADGAGYYPRLLLVKNHIQLGSILVISTQQGKHYSFDTSLGIGWRPVTLNFKSSELKFLPLDPLSSVPVGEGVIYSYVDSHSFPRPYFGRPYFGRVVRGGQAEKSFLKSLNIGDGDSYVCSFKYDAHAQRLDLSIKPVRGITGMIKWGEHVNYDGPIVDVAGIWDGLVMFVKTGSDRFNTEWCSSLNLFRIQEEGDHYVASNISTALFRLGLPSHFSSFIFKNGIFT